MPLDLPRDVIRNVARSRLHAHTLQIETEIWTPEAPYIPHALPTSSQTVFGFLSQRHNRLCHFISDIMDYFLAGEDQQQTNQPNDLAGG